MGNKMDTWEDIGNVIDGIKNVYDTVQQGVETYASIDNGEVRDNYMRICCIEDDIKRIKIKFIRGPMVQPSKKAAKTR